MAQVIVRNLGHDTVRRLKQRARRKGHSLAHELRQILAEAASQELDAFRAQAAAVRERYEGKVQTDSALLLREDRDRSSRPTAVSLSDRRTPGWPGT